MVFHCWVFARKEEVSFFFLLGFAIVTGWKSISFWSPNSTELRLLFINFFKIMVWKKTTKIYKVIIFKKKNHKMSRTKPVQYKWDQLKDWVAKWLTFERIKGTSPTWLPQSWNMGLLMPSDSNWNTGSAWAYTIDSPGPIAFWLLLLGL